MSAPKFFLITALAAFSVLGIVATLKKNKISSNQPTLDLSPRSDQNLSDSETASQDVFVEVVREEPTAHFPSSSKAVRTMPTIDRTYQLFNTGQNKFPIVETLAYSSTVPWLKGRPAWVADYAAYFNTSKHFIARSLHGRPDYFNQTISAGRMFNVFKKDKELQFHLVADINQSRMGLFYYDLTTKERVLIKTYSISAGRIDADKPSGTLTPLGVYQLGDKIAIYDSLIKGSSQASIVEMVKVFGTRWIPFGQALPGATEPAKGYGIHGVPWVQDTKSNQLVENRDSIGKRESNGCIRLLKEDMEELFAIVITKPTYIHIVKDFQDAQLPGTEVAIPTR
ncbi:MAG: L,D-transpeptidase [Chlamydiae bacterium]|nr:L,D-transpeptidase [Chlamydiota bacterium]